MYWTLYIATSFILSHIIASILKKNYYLVMYFLLVILFTPAQIDLNGSNFAPSIFAFIFNFIFERDYSLRVLRPLLISLPVSLTLFFLIFYTKKRFFQQ